MTTVLKELFLLIIGTIVFLILFVIGFCYTFLKHIFKLDYNLKKQLAPLIRSVTLSIDGLANSGSGELLNDVFKVHGKIKYGKWYQTISAVTGLIFLHIKDTKLRVFLDKILGANHCVISITPEDKFYNEQKEN